MSVLDPRHFKVLCIEDEPEILRDLVEELRDYGFEVGEAPNAEAALPLIETLAPHLIVCDMQMPGMNGLELLHKLRARRDDLAAVPFVFLTAFGDRDSVITGRRAGADDYLVKPVDYDLLIAAVESHLRNVAQRAEKVSAASLVVAEAEGLPGREDLQRRLETAAAVQSVAVVRIDDMAEVGRRFAGHDPRHAYRLAARLARMAGIDLYWLKLDCCVLLPGAGANLDRALARLADFALRDSDGGGQARTRVPLSIVTGRPDERGAMVLVDQLVESARLLQRDGGGRTLALDDPALSEMRLANSIRSELVNAINQGQMHVCFQPKVRASDGRPLSAEVLVRWDSPLLGQLSPGTFIPVVERAGLLSHVTDWVLRQTALCQVRLREAGLPARLAVNIGGSEFTSGLADRIAAICADVGADMRDIEVEITETSLLEDPDSASAIVEALHARGVSVALDDFGTGFSSLSHLQSCAVDMIKIDRSFVRQVAEEGTDQKIVLGIIRLAQMLGVETVAEGVELESQRRWLRENNCATLQGYLISRPLRFETYCDLLRDWPDA